MFHCLAGGNAYLHWRLSRFYEKEENTEKATFHRQKSVQAVKVALSLLPKPTADALPIAFYIGTAGETLQVYQAVKIYILLLITSPQTKVGLVRSPVRRPEQS